VEHQKVSSDFQNDLKSIFVISGKVADKDGIDTARGTRP